MLLKTLSSGFKRTIYWNKYLSEVTTQAQRQYLNYPIDLSFQGVDRPKACYLLKVELKDRNVIIDVKNFLDRPMKDVEVMHDNLRKFAVG